MSFEIYEFPLNRLRKRVSIIEKLFQYDTELPQKVRVASVSTCCVNYYLFHYLNWKQKVPQLKGHGNEADFLGFLKKLVLIDPLHYLSSRSAFGFEFAEIFVIEKRLPDSASRRIGDSPNRRLSESASRGVADSPTRRVGESTTHRLA
jgi:hypothetical protein